MVGAVLIDLKKAFNSVWHEGLLFKLHKLNAPLTFIKLINNLISNTKFRVSIGKLLSLKIFVNRKGLPQGTVNSPSLFNIFTAKLNNLFGMNSVRGAYSMTFADDQIEYFAEKSHNEIKKPLQKLYDQTDGYYESWKLVINPKKCETILFRGPLSDKSRKERKN